MTDLNLYSSPEAFKQALEARLRQAGNMNRARQILQVAHGKMYWAVLLQFAGNAGGSSLSSAQKLLMRLPGYSRIL